MELEDFKKFISQVQGLCKEEDCFFLYSLARDLRIEGDILDIGSFKGRVSIALALGLKDQGQKNWVYAVESNFFGSKKELLKNIARMDMKDFIFPIFKHSSLASKGWQKKLKLIWVDTDGNYFSGKCDFLLWEPYLLKGGVIAFSCAQSSKIQRLVEECIIGSGRFTDIHNAGNIVYAYKDKESPPYSRFRIILITNLYFLHYNIRKLLYEVRRKFCPLSTGKDSAIKKLVNDFFERFLQ